MEPNLLPIVENIMTKDTADPATWTQGRLLKEVYHLKDVQNELVETLEECAAVVRGTNKVIHTIEADMVLDKAKQALERSK